MWKRGLLSLMLLLFLSSCVEEQTDCILFCQGDSTVEFLTTSSSAVESAGTVRVYVSVTPAPVSSFQVDYSLNSSLTTASASDYAFQSGTITFNAGETRKYFEFVVSNDAIGDEGNEYVSFKLGIPTAGSLGEKSTITYAIIDDDVTDLSIAEGATGSTVPLSCDDGSGALQTFTITTQSDSDSNCTFNSGDRRVYCTPNYKAGHLDWSSNLVVDCQQNGNSTPISFVVDVTSTNQPPTLTSLASLTGTGAQTSIPTTISYSDLAAAGNEADADSDTIYFMVTSIDDGTLTKGGNPVQTNIDYIGSGESFVWTPSNTAQGSVNAFKIVARDSSDVSSVMQVVVDGVFNFAKPAPITLTEGTLYTGVVPLNCDDGTAGAPTYDDDQTGFGAYDADGNCTLTSTSDPAYITCNPNYKPGHSNWSFQFRLRCDLNALTKYQTVVINVNSSNQPPTFTAMDNFTGGSAGVGYSITYAQLDNAARVSGPADAKDADFDNLTYRIETLDGSGTLTRSGVPVVPGTTVLKAGETLVYTPGEQDLGNVNIFSILAYDGYDVSASAIPVLLEVSGVSPVADMSINENDTYQTGFLDCFDANLGPPVFSIFSESDLDSNCSITGTHPSARVQCAPAYKASQTNWTSDVTLRCNRGGANIDHTFTVNVNNVNRPPTMTSLTTLSAAIFGATKTITYADLQAAANEADLDGDTIYFKIMSVNEGTVTKNSAAVVPGTTTIGPGEEVEWDADPTSVGLITMFSVVAYDGTDDSATTLPVKTALNGIVPFADLSVNEGSTAETELLSCDDAVSGVPSYSIFAESDGDSNCWILTGKVSCTPAYKAGQSAWTSIVTVRCNVGGSNYDRSFTVYVGNDNQAPTMTTIENVTSVDMDNPVTITYADVQALANEADPDSDPVAFRMGTLLAGDLYKDGQPFLGGEVLDTGEELVWYPPPGQIGTISAFTLKATDGSLDSATFITLKAEVGGLIPLANMNLFEGFSSLSTFFQCDDGAGSLPAYSITNQTDPMVNCTIQGTHPTAQLECVPTPKAGQNNWASQVTLECNVGDETYQTVVDTYIGNVNQAPSLNAFTPIPNVNKGDPITITYVDLLSYGDEADIDGDDLVFIIQTIPSGDGTLTKGGTPVTVGPVEVASGESIVWTPNPADEPVGLTDIATFIVRDASLNSTLTSGTCSNVTYTNKADCENALETWTPLYVPLRAQIKGFKPLADFAGIEGTLGSSNAMVCDDGLGSIPGYVVLSQSAPDSTCVANGGTSKIDCTPAYKLGQGDWSSDVLVECSVGAETFSQTVTVNVTNTNQAPTLTVLSDRVGPKSEVEYSLSFSQLESVANEYDADGDTLSFRIESVVSGTLTKGGVAVTPGVTTIASGETVEWTSDVDDFGDDIVAFQVKAFDGSLASATAMDVRFDQVMDFDPITFTPANVDENGGPYVSANLNCNYLGGENYTLISESDGDSNCSITTGAGPYQIICNPAYKDDQSDWTSDLVVECDDSGVTFQRTYTVNVNNVNRPPTFTTFATTMLGAESEVPFAITYADLASSGDEADADTLDTISFRIESISSGTLTKGGTEVTPGVTTIGPGESVVWTSANGASGDTNAFTAVAYDGTDISGSGAQTVVIEGLMDFDTIPTLTMNEGATASTGNLSCVNGNVVSFSIPTQGPDSNCLIVGGGPYQVQCMPSFITGQASWQDTITVRCDDGTTSVDKQFTLDVTNVNRAPTITSVTDFTGAQAGVPYTITFAQLQTNADEADADADSVFFKIMTVPNGTLRKNGIPVIPGSTTVMAGDSLEWTSLSTAEGDTVGFTIRATDGIDDNGSNINVTMAAVLRFDDIADIAGNENALTSTAALYCNDGTGEASADFTVTPISMTDADANCVPSAATGPGATIDCTPAYKSGHLNWSSTVTVTCTANGLSRSKTFDIDVTDANQAPTVIASTPANMPNLETGQSITLTHAQLLAGTDAADLDGDTIIFSVDTILTGTMLKNGVPISSSATHANTITTSDTLTWTDPGSAGGAVGAFTISVNDGYGWAGLDMATVSINVLEFVDTTPTLYDIAVNEGATQFHDLSCDDGNGGTTATLSLVSESDADSNCAVISSPPRVSCTPAYKQSPITDWSSNLVVRCVKGATTIDQNFTVTVTNVNRAPTLTSFSVLKPGIFNNGSNTRVVTYAEIAGLGDAADADNDNIQYLINGVNDGVVELDADGDDTYEVADVTAGGPHYITTTSKIRWTPSAPATGDTSVLDLRAYDGALDSGSDISFSINAFVFNITSPLAVNEGSTSATPPMTCTDGTATTPVYAVINHSSGDATCSISTNAVSCSPIYRPGPGNWSDTVTVRCTVGTESQDIDLTVNVTHQNQVPTLTTVTGFTGAFSNTPYVITYAQLMAAANEADLDLDTVTFVIQSVGNGVVELDQDGDLTYETADVTDGGGAVGTNYEVQSTSNIRWTPAAFTNGNTGAFVIKAYDGIDESATGITVNVDTDLEAAVLSSTVTDHNFGNVNYGASPANHTVTVTNVGEVAPVFNQVQLSKGFILDPTSTCPSEGGTPGIATSCTFVINVDSNYEHQGIMEGALKLYYNDGYADQNFTVETFQFEGVATTGGSGFAAFGVPTEATGSNPTSIVAGNFDGAGTIDYAVANFSSGTVTVLNSTSANATLTAGTNPNDIAVGDIDNDGNLDLVVANSGSDDISVFSGNGDGTFGTETSLTIGSDPYAVALADINGDEKLDIIVTDYTAGAIYHATGNGDFTFGSATSVSVGTNPVNITVEDINSDGGNDLLVVNNGSASISVLINDMTTAGSFSVAQTLTVNSFPNDVEAADLDGDGDMDIVVSSIGGGGKVDSYLNAGAGSMNTTAADTNTVPNANSVHLGDFNGDGEVDFVAARRDPAANNFAVTGAGVGDGTFSTISDNVTSGDQPKDCIVADHDADGIMDIICVDFASSQVSYLEGQP